MSDLTNKIEFPVLDQEKLEAGSLPKSEVLGWVEKTLQSLLHVSMLKSSGTSYLARETLDEAQKIDEKLNQLKEQFPQLRGATQNILGRTIKEMAAQSGDSKTLFNRLRILTAEAEYQGSLQEWKEADLEKVPAGLIKSFLVKLYDPRTKEARYFLPKNWRHPVHKRTALILKDLSFKAREAYKAERGIPKTEPPKSETTTFLPETPKTQAETELTKPRTPKKPRKPEAETKKKGAKAAIQVEEREKDDNAEIREAKKVGSFAEIKNILPAEKK